MMIRTPLLMSKLFCPTHFSGNGTWVGYMRYASRSRTWSGEKAWRRPSGIMETGEDFLAGDVAAVEGERFGGRAEGEGAGVGLRRVRR